MVRFRGVGDLDAVDGGNPNIGCAADDEAYPEASVLAQAF
jgi:hypothetical protein